VTDVDREARAAKKAAAKRAAASGWYRNLHGTMSFAGLAGLNVAVEGQQDGDADTAGVAFCPFRSDGFSFRFETKKVFLTIHTVL